MSSALLFFLLVRKIRTLEACWKVQSMLFGGTGCQGLDSRPRSSLKIELYHYLHVPTIGNFGSIIALEVIKRVSESAPPAPARMSMVSRLLTMRCLDLA
jgi:hypothetical protein